MSREGNCTYSLTLNTSFRVSQTDVLHDSLLAFVQVLRLGQQDKLILCVLTEEIVGLAHTLCSRLVDIKTVCQYCGSL